MISINALSLSPCVNKRLVDSSAFRILHVFDHVCNLINENGEILSIVTPYIGNGPFNMVVEDDICFFDFLSLESPISISANGLHLGDLIVTTTNAKLWSPRPDWERLHRSIGEITNQLTNVRVNCEPILLPTALISSLSIAVANADLSSARKLTSRLAGLGIGLTPSGDDFLMGAIYAAWMIHPPEIGSSLAQEIANTAAPLTTSLSAAWLRSAGKGEAGVLWHELLNALLSNDSLKIQETLKNILAVGETSGADALAGFVAVFLAWMEKAGSSHG